MAVERARSLAGLNDVVRIAKVFGAENRPDAREVGSEPVPLLEMLELQLVDVDDAIVDDAHDRLPAFGKADRIVDLRALADQRQDQAQDLGQLPVDPVEPLSGKIGRANCIGDGSPGPP